MEINRTQDFEVKLQGRFEMARFDNYSYTAKDAIKQMNNEYKICN